MTVQEQHSLEADRIALHVVGRTAGEREKELYSRAVETLGLTMTGKEADLWQSMVRSRRMMAWADAGLALARPSSGLRRRLLVMVAILEASPAYAEQFLPRQVPLPRALPVAFAAVRGAFRGAAGVILVKAAGL